LALLTPVWYTGTVPRGGQKMRKSEKQISCKECGEKVVFAELLENGFMCFKCYAVKFQKEFQSALEKARAK
jgi:ribosomal protein S27AE